MNHSKQSVIIVVVANLLLNGAFTVKEVYTQPVGLVPKEGYVMKMPTSSSLIITAPHLKKKGYVFDLTGTATITTGSSATVTAPIMSYYQTV
jgi:hypothetical protein